MDLFLMCLLVFFGRIFDVSLSVFRTLCNVKGKTVIAVIIGFIEALIWFVVIKDAMSTDSTSFLIALAYAGGFAMGTLVGNLLSKVLIKTNVNIQVITSEGNKELIKTIRAAGYGLTSLTVYGKSSQDRKYMLFIETTVKKLKPLKDIIKTNDENAFIIVNESKEVINGYFANQK